MARVTSDYNLAVMNPALAGQWHPKLNGDPTPRPVAPFSGKRPWWLCPKGHEWMSRVSHRKDGTGCPHCPRRKAHEDNCLTTLAPHIASEWHPTKNGDLTPRDMTKCSNKKAWWMCRKGHEWEARISSRHRSGCPVCWREESGKHVAKRAQVFDVPELLDRFCMVNIGRASR
jgi:Probable Zinc-ribbon domain